MCLAFDETPDIDGDHEPCAKFDGGVTESHGPELDIGLVSPEPMSN
jgi:hypothetical protein